MDIEAGDLKASETVTTRNADDLAKIAVLNAMTNARREGVTFLLIDMEKGSVGPMPCDECKAEG